MRMRTGTRLSALYLATATLYSSNAFTTHSSSRSLSFGFRSAPLTVLSADVSGDSSSSADVATPPPSLDGKRVLPYKVLAAGLSGHRVAAVYAVLNKGYARGTDGWGQVEYVGVSQDLAETLSQHAANRPADSVAHIRALSFSVPQPNAMQEIAMDWRNKAKDAGADNGIGGATGWEADAMEYLFDDDDDDDDDDELELEMLSQATAALSNNAGDVSPAVDVVESSSDESAPEFTVEGVDKVLDEVRPYLIADGGNVAVERVDSDAGTVTLKLEGACGSCSSSTVTMQMGIERVLKEKYPSLTEVLQVEEDEDAQPKALDFAAVKEEVGRLAPAIMAMGGNVQLLSVDPETGVVKVEYRGPSKVQQGIELALLDVPFVKHVEFVMDS